jgi:cytochrome c peroxidase
MRAGLVAGLLWASASVHADEALRNQALRTAPYFHDGSVETLGAAVRIMASLQLDKKLDDAAASDIVAFLESLTGEVPETYAPPGQRPSLQ